MKLKLNESKILEFEMDTTGCSWKELQGYFRLPFEGIEYGFPVKFEDGIIRVEIPAFSKILPEHITKSYLTEKNKEVIIKGRIDIIANNEAYISPWNGNVEIEIPVTVRISEEKKEIKEIIKEVKEVKEEIVEDKKISKFFEKDEIEEKKKSKFSMVLSEKIKK
jgi:hypothetical protein